MPKKIITKEKNLQYYLIDKNKITIPNYYYKGFECDIFCVTNKNYTTEYEIKNSVQDFRKDKLKAKKDGRFNAVYKHEEIYAGMRTNRFFLVMPEWLYEKIKEEIPEEFGVIIQQREWDFEIKKQSKRFHNKKYNEFEDLAKSLNWRLYRCINK